MKLKVIILYIILSIVGGRIFAQNDPTIGLKQSADSVFRFLNLTGLPTNYLLDKSRWMFDPAKYTGTLVTDKVGNPDDWKVINEALDFSCISCTYTAGRIKYLTDYDFNMSQTSDVISIGLVNADYNKIKDDAIANNLLIAAENVLYDNYVSPANPYETKRLFAASALRNKQETSSVKFKLDGNLLKTNVPPPSSYSIDFGDGYGYRNVSVDQVVTISYPDYGSKTIKVKAVSSSSSLISSFSFIAGVPDQVLGLNGFPDFSIQLNGLLRDVT